MTTPAEPQSRLRAADILALLRVRHSKDLFVPECKDGPTHTAQHRRLDAWVMRRSWVNPCYDGYEIKVSRSDFLADQKLHLYLPLCNRLWVVCPNGLIEPDELPAEIGLLWVASTGSRLTTKRKAAHRMIDPPYDLLTYVLMCRTTIGDEHGDIPTREERAAFWRDVVAGRVELREIGQRVSGAIREKIEEEREAARRSIVDANDRRNKAEDRAHALELVDHALRELGIEVLDVTHWTVRNRIARALRHEELIDAAKTARRKLDALIAFAESTRSPSAADGEEVAL